MGEYRPNVAALVVNEKGLLLICERLLNPGAWQFPQGGVDEGESAAEAILREVREEIGLSPEDYVLENFQGGYRYDYPPEVRASRPAHKSQFLGQEQVYFLCRLKEEANEIDLTQEPREFSQARWIAPEDFKLDWLPDFKKETYQAVFRDFFEVELG
jgi:putative (di)nucleoside polyphosphate hydrolase